VFSLSIGEPNPVRQRTSFRFDIAAPVPVTLLVFDVGGRVVREAYRAVPFAAGRFEWAWDGRDDRGTRLGAGLYFVRLETPRFRRTVRAILLGSAP
jgi:flagellar hook assembly protein FlgD